MVHRELLRSKNILWLSCLLLLSCSYPGNKRQATFFILADTVNVVTKQGITYINNDKANGILFSLYRTMALKRLQTLDMWKRLKQQLQRLKTYVQRYRIVRVAKLQSRPLRLKELDCFLHQLLKNELAAHQWSGESHD